MGRDEDQRRGGPLTRNGTIPAVLGATNQAEIVNTLVEKRENRGRTLEEVLDNSHVQALKSLSGNSLEGFIRAHLKSRPNLQSAAFWRWTPEQEPIEEKRVLQRQVLGSYDTLTALLSSILDTPHVAGVKFVRTHDTQLTGMLSVYKDSAMDEEKLEESKARVILAYKKI
jgi:hypothetical protein